MLVPDRAIPAAMAKEIKFRRFVDAVDAILENSYGISLDDLPDQPMDDMFESGCSVDDAIEDILEREGFDL